MQEALFASLPPAEERPEPIVEPNFEHLNLAARGERVADERPWPKCQVIQFEEVILKLRRPISRYRPAKGRPRGPPGSC
jgi:hypothetical protein